MLSLANTLLQTVTSSPLYKINVNPKWLSSYLQDFFLDVSFLIADLRLCWNISTAIFYELKEWFIWLVFQKKWLYDQIKMAYLEHAWQLLCKEPLPAKVGIRDGNPIVCWNPTETNSTKYVVCFEANWNNAWTLANFHVTRTCIFSYCITFYPNTSVHLRLSHHSQGDHSESRHNGWQPHRLLKPYWNKLRKICSMFWSKLK